MNSAIKNRRYLVSLFLALFFLNLADLIAEGSKYHKATVRLEMFIDRPVATDNETYITNLSEEAKDAFQNIVLNSLELLLITFLWVYSAREKVPSSGPPLNREPQPAPLL